MLRGLIPYRPENQSKDDAIVHNRIPIDDSSNGMKGTGIDIVVQEIKRSPKGSISFCDVYIQWCIGTHLICCMPVYHFPYSETKGRLSSLRRIIKEFPLELYNQSNGAGNPEGPLDCPICIQDCTASACSVRMPCCNSLIHTWCIVECMCVSSPSCPMCRSSCTGILQEILDPVQRRVWIILWQLGDAIWCVERTFLRMMDGFYPSVGRESILDYCMIQTMAIERCLRLLESITGCSVFNAIEDLRLYKCGFYIHAERNCVGRMSRLQEIFLGSGKFWKERSLCPLEFPMSSD